MAVNTRFSNIKRVGNIGTDKTIPVTTNFGKGISTYKPNDMMGLDELYLAQNVRFDKIGEYKTRYGLTALCEPIGKTKSNDNFSESFEWADFNSDGFNVEVSGDGGLYEIDLKLKKTNDEYGVVRVNLLDSDDNLIGVSCVENISSDGDEYAIKFVDSPEVENGDVVKVYLEVQGEGKGEFKVGVVGDDLMCKVYVADIGEVSDIFEANIDGVRTVFFSFISGDNASLYKMNELGVVSLVRNLPNGVKKVRFCQNINEVRYVDGEEGLRKLTYSAGVWTDSKVDTLDLTTETDLQLKLRNIIDGTEDNLMYFDGDVDTQVLWGYPYGTNYVRDADYVVEGESIIEYDEKEPQPQVNTLTMNKLKPATNEVKAGDIISDSAGLNFAEVVSDSSSATFTANSISHIAVPINSYDYFDRRFRQNLPAILTGDPLTAMFNLGGVMYVLTRKNKYYIYNQSVDVWDQKASNAQNGTFSQESVVCDLNYAYFANDNGIYVFDGSSEGSITQNTIQNVYDAIVDKEKITLDLYNNRLYVFYPSKSGGVNDSCLIYNINLKVWESFDSGVYVSGTSARKNSSNRFICGHSRLGMLMLGEDKETANFSDLGRPIDVDLETSYMCFGKPSQYKRIVEWRPEFGMVDNEYSVKCGWSVDFDDYVKYAFSINLKNKVKTYDRYVWDNPSNYGVVLDETKLTTIPQIYGEWRRCQIKYQHHAAFEPISFKSHTLSIEIQRIR